MSLRQKKNPVFQFDDFISHFGAKVPIHAPKQQGQSNCEEKPLGSILIIAPVRQMLFP